MPDNKWQPIDTAPKDTRLLIWSDYGHGIAQFSTAHAQWIGQGLDTADTQRLNSVNPPTLWAPLLPKPEQEEVKLQGYSSETTA